MADDDHDEPDIYAFTDYRTYVRAWLAAKGRRLSQNGLARRIGVSQGMFSAILGGSRDLSAIQAEAIVKVFGMDEDQRAYFLAMVEHDQAPTLARKREATERIQGVRRFREAQRIEDERYFVLSSWYRMAIIELARLPGFQADPAWIAATLVPRITEEQAKEALAALEHTGYLVRQGDTLVSAQPDWATAHEAAPLVRAVRELHRSILARGMDAIETIPPEDRHYGTVSIAIPGDRVAELKRLAERFQEEVLGRFSSADAADRVYQVSVQIFPVSSPAPPKR